MIRSITGRAPGVATALLLLLVAVLWTLPVLAADPDLKRLPGYVDCSRFKELGDGAEETRVEVNLSGSILRVITKGLGPELGAALGGLESLRAVILELHGDARVAAREAIAETRSSLEGKGWQQLALIREEGSEVHVLILDDGDAINGLLVLVNDDDGEVVCVNVAGLIDLAALEVFLEDGLDLPGLDEVDLK